MKWAWLAIVLGRLGFALPCCAQTTGPCPGQWLFSLGTCTASATPSPSPSPSPLPTPTPLAMAYEYQAPVYGNGNASQSTLTTASLATTPPSGEKLLFVWDGTISSLASPTGVTGWTQLYFDSSSNPQQAAWYKTATGSDAKQVTLALNGGGNNNSQCVYDDIANASSAAPTYVEAFNTLSTATKILSSNAISVATGDYAIAGFDYNGLTSYYVPGTAIGGDASSGTFVDSPLTANVVDTLQAQPSNGVTDDIVWMRGTYTAAGMVEASDFNSALTEYVYSKGTPQGTAAMIVVAPSTALVTPSPSPTPVAVTALAAAGFVSMQGLNIHLNYSGTSYSQYLTTPAPNGNTITSAVQNLGIQHVRQGGITTSSTLPTCAQFQTFLAAIGGDTIIGVGSGDTSSTWAAEYGCSGTATLGFEGGPNEYNAPGAGTYNNGSTWYTTPYNYQTALYAARGSSFPSGLIICAAPLTSTESVVDFQSLENYSTSNPYSSYTTCGDIHSYSGIYPDGPGNGPLLSWTSATGASKSAYAGSFLAQIGATGYAGIDSTGPTLVTEFGWSDSVNDPEGGGWVDDSTRLKYILRNLLLAYRGGVSKMYLYELARQNYADQYYGLMDQFLNVTPAYTALRNLNSILSDSGSFTLGSLSFAVNAGGRTDVNTLLLEKHDGSFWLVTWLADNGWDKADGTSGFDIAVPSASATLLLSATPAYLADYTLSSSTGAASKATPAPATSLALTITDTPQVVQIGTSTAPTLATPQPIVCPSGDPQTINCGNNSSEVP